MTIIIPNSLTEIAKNKLREMIISGELAFGQQLAETKLSMQFGVSKTPIREALVQLKEEGLVEIRARRGTFVYSPDAKDMNHILETRAIIETGALRLAHEKNHVNLVHALGKIVRQMDKPFDQNTYKTYLELDTEFHKTIIVFADNPYMSTAYATIAAKVRALRHRLRYDADFILRSTQGHLAIYEGIRGNALEETEKRLHSHISGVFMRVELSPLIADKDLNTG